ncbi:MAG: hypothetical protein WBP54_04715 [Pelodictyon phaeoclathratiforme]|jgi:hypothetical protein
MMTRIYVCNSRLYLISFAFVIFLAGQVIIGCESPPVSAPAAPGISYQVIDQWPIPNGGYGRAIVVDPKNCTDSGIRALGDKLRSDTALDRNAFVFIYNDSRAAGLRKAALDERLNKKDLKYHDNHMVGSYMRNANTGHHRLSFGLSGVNGPQTIMDY